MPLTSNQRTYLKQLEGSLQKMEDKRTSFKGMIYGDSGVGKTVFAMQLAQRITPNDRGILYLDSAEGWVSLDNHKHLKARTTYAKFSVLETFEALGAAISSKEAPWDHIGTIVLDEFSSMAIDDLDSVVQNRSTFQANKDPDTPAQPDYNTNTNRVRKYLGDLIGLPEVNLILTSHLRKDQDGAKRETISPAFLPKLNAHIRGMLHIVAYMTAEEFTAEDKTAKYARTLQVHPTSRIVAKSRIGGLNPIVTTKELGVGVEKWLAYEAPTVPEQTVIQVPAIEATIMEEGE